ncbi:ABC-2 transporter permease [Clostridium botulinum]|uniref:ABC transporter permease n=2 Tax=Clostridium botulinum TaxID=1491 RepID=A0A0A0IB80_CLOBO|nr:ABC-2 transporter permease [Clostridium botulinum]KGM98480.1 hypothetical protein Z956_00020 [Clostridium botulinum D str. CCUG 7971]KGM98709.1 hypothetical protein Z955_10585 [Clostridium botulinum C/D str. DC5]KOC47160.1 hypothetical protein ADU88_10990 [Clostridium botulinum]KOC55104.1 hypothetical protein ADU89_06235 [Clostridium botulinum]KOC55357.1 hypothetical protein ADU90_11080 [Clostridium botulinum]
MRNYFNKALIYREWRNTRAIAMMFLLELIGFVILPFIDLVKSTRLNEIKYIPFKDIESLVEGYFGYDRYLILVLSVIFIGSIISSYDLLGHKYDVLNSMPFKREEIIIAKWSMSFLCCIVPIIISYITVFLVYFMNRDFMGKYVTENIIFKWGSINILIFIFVLMFIMFIQSLSGVSIIGSIIGGILLVVPFEIVDMVSGLIRIKFFDPHNGQYMWEAYDKLNSVFHDIAKVVSPVTYNRHLLFEGFQGSRGVLNVNTKIIILTVTIIILGVLLVYSFKKVPLERMGYIVVFKPLEVICKIGVSICFGLLLANIAAPIISSYYNLWELKNQSATNITHMVNKACIITILIGLLGGCIVYVITNKIIEANKR